MACLLVLRCSALVGGAVCPAAVAGSMDSVATGPSATNRRSSQNDWQKRSAAAMLGLPVGARRQAGPALEGAVKGDRKSTRLNSSHLVISYAVFCLKKKKMLHHDGRYAPGHPYTT